MRAREFIIERLITHGDNQFKIERLEPGDEEYADMKVSVLDDWGNEAGFAKFASDGKDLDPRALKVHDRYRGQGFAKLIYDFMKAKGYRIIRSWDQTEDGKDFWNKNRGEDVRVWEDKQQETIVYHGNQGGIHRELITPMWWTESYEDAKYYATQGGADGWVYKAKLTCKNPYVVQRGKDEPNNLANNFKKLEQTGYDCIHDPSVGDWIPFNNTDIQLMGKEYVEGKP